MKSEIKEIKEIKEIGLLEKVFEKAFERKRSICLIGDYGIGKSAMVYQYAEKKANMMHRKLAIWHELTEEEKKKISENIEKYFVLVDIKLQSVGDISKITGIPVILNGDGEHKIFWQPPEFIKILSNEKSAGIFFLDEINMALPSLQSTTFEILLQRKIGEWKLSDNILIISAGNTLEANISANPIPKPQLNRVILLNNLTISVDEWLRWAIRNNIDERIIAFVKLFEELHKDSEEELKQSTRPRSYELLSDMIKGETDINYIRTIAFATLHEITASKFVKFIEIQNKIDYKKILQHTELYKNLEHQEKYALISILANKYKEVDKNKFIELFKIISDDMLELSAVLLSMIKMKYSQEELITILKDIDIERKEKLLKLVI